MALLSEKLRDRIRNQGRVEGRVEESSKRRDWFERYEDARKKGEPFDEPPPDRR